jgi:transportin-1
MQCSEELASALQNIAPTWCVAMRRLRDGVEKEHAFKGLCELIKVNPNGGMNCLKEICEAIASWRQCRSQEVSSAMRDVLQGYKNHIGADQWAQLERNHLEPAVVQKLKQTYGV